MVPAELKRDLLPRDLQNSAMLPCIFAKIALFSQTVNYEVFKWVLSLSLQERSFLKTFLLL